MGALEKVSAMIRSLPGTWEIMKLYFIVQRQNHWTQIGSSSTCFVLNTGTRGL